VVVHADPRLSPWVDPADLRRRGALIVWEQGRPGEPMPPAWHAIFPNAVAQHPLELARHALHPGRPARVGYAIAPPQ
jgi:hypothetical protein